MSSEKSLKELLADVGVEVRQVIDKNQFKGVSLHDAVTGEKLHSTPVACYDRGVEIYQERLNDSL